MIATIVNANASTAQVWFLIAVILFIIAGVIALLEKSIYTVLICAGLVFSALGLLFFS